LAVNVAVNPSSVVAAMPGLFGASEVQILYRPPQGLTQEGTRGPKTKTNAGHQNADTGTTRGTTEATGGTT